MLDMLDDAAYVHWLQQRYSDARDYAQGDVCDSRRQALDYYLRRPMGDEREGRSRVVSGDVYKVVEGVSTAIADIFCSSADAVQFSARSADDVAKAQQRTETVNYTFWTTCKGYLPMLEAIKSGVHLKTGYLQWYWHADRRLTRERYTRLTDDALMMLTADAPGLRIVEQTTTVEPGEAGPVRYHDVVADVVSATGRIVVESVPPEQVFVSPQAKTANLQQAPSVFVTAFKTREQAMMCGYSAEQIEALEFGTQNWDDQIDRERDYQAGSEEVARIVTAYVECDRDGDGVVELRKSVFSGDVILSDEVTDEINVSSWTPNIQPHEFYGRCPAEDAMQGQELNTTLWRQTLDNLYHANNPQWLLDSTDSRVNIEDFHSPEIGRPLHAPPGSAQAVSLPFVAQHTFPMLEYSTSDMENLTGFTRYSQGLDAQSLNKTLGGLRMITNMSQQRVRMMARNFGEMCLAPCMRGIAKLLSQHNDKPLQVRISGQYVQIDPREWSEEYDLVVNVGLGTVDREQQAQQWMQVAAAQQAAVQGGALGKLLTPKNLYNVQAKLADLAGSKDPAFAWTDPDSVPPAPPGPPPVPPEVLKEQMRIQADAQKLAAQSQMDLQRWQAEQAAKAAEKQREETMNIEVERIKQQGETQREAMRIQAQQQASAAPLMELAPLVNALGQTLQMMQQTLALLAAPKQGRAIKNEDGSFTMVSEPMSPQGANSTMQ